MRRKGSGGERTGWRRMNASGQQRKGRQGQAESGAGMMTENHHDHGKSVAEAEVKLNWKAVWLKRAISIGRIRSKAPGGT